MDVSNSAPCITRGDEYLAKHKDFKLVGRDRELKELIGLLMRKDASNVLLCGPGGVGCSAICLGLQASKTDPNTPFDIINKRIFFLDTDALFASGDPAVINQKFDRMMATVSNTPARDTVLIVEDARDFIQGINTHGCSHFMNAIMRDTRAGRFQVIFETRDSDLEVVLAAHSDMREAFTVMDVEEPNDGPLKEIVRTVSQGLSAHHKINISEAAMAKAIELTTKYRVRDLSLSRAQPERALNLLDRALTSYRQTAHTRPPPFAFTGI